uniref:Uncharacterized protein n=1 Tax=Steinernema glaseri TaxID=37863 RepID=A0A1I8AT36_9BILA
MTTESRLTEPNTHLTRIMTRFWAVKEGISFPDHCFPRKCCPRSKNSVAVLSPLDTKLCMQSSSYKTMAAQKKMKKRLKEYLQLRFAHACFVRYESTSILSTRNGDYFRLQEMIGQVAKNPQTSVNPSKDDAKR